MEHLGEALQFRGNPSHSLSQGLVCFAERRECDAGRRRRQGNAGRKGKAACERFRPRPLVVAGLQVCETEMIVVDRFCGAYREGTLEGRQSPSTSGLLQDWIQPSVSSGSGRRRSEAWAIVARRSAWDRAFRQPRRSRQDCSRQRQRGALERLFVCPAGALRDPFWLSCSIPIIVRAPAAGRRGAAPAPHTAALRRRLALAGIETSEQFVSFQLRRVASNDGLQRLLRSSCISGGELDLHCQQRILRSAGFPFGDLLPRRVDLSIGEVCGDDALSVRRSIAVPRSAS